MNELEARKKLSKLIRPIADENKKYLARVKRESKKQGERDDLIWLSLLGSMATMGNVRGYLGLICTKENYDKVTFDAITLTPSKDRLKILNSTLRAAKVRMPEKKAKWLVENFEKIVAMGGLSSAKKKLFELKGKEAKIKFWDDFQGISDKYARNIMMDIYHVEFRNSIAVDERIKRITAELGLSFSDYESHEQFYLSVAKDVELEGWELDRLMFRCVDEIICLLRESA